MVDLAPPRPNHVQLQSQRFVGMVELSGQPTVHERWFECEVVRQVMAGPTQQTALATPRLWQRTVLSDGLAHSPRPTPGNITVDFEARQKCFFFGPVLCLVLRFANWKIVRHLPLPALRQKG